ncbi:Bacterial conjugation TrbI-like protein [compost metagenome]
MSPEDSSQDMSPPSPKVAPESLELRTQPRPVTRLDPRMLAVIAGGLAAAVLGAMLWSLQPRQHHEGAAQRELYNVDQVARSEGLDQLPSDYSQLPRPKPPVPELGPPLPGDLGGPILKAGRQGQGYPHTNPTEPDRQARLKEEEQAMLSSVFFRLTAQKAPTTAMAKRQALSGSRVTGFDTNMAGAASLSMPAPDSFTNQNHQDQKEAFLSKAGSAETHSSGFLQTPDSPYQIMAGSVIAAALVTGIRSDLPGDVIATVTEPVFDSATGQHVLIPQGSRLLGRYNSQVSYGQRRVQVVWQRVILPDTSSFQLDNLVGSDPAGYAGLEDQVDWHWDRIVAGAAMTTLLGIGAELAAPENRSDGDRIIIAGRDGLQDTVNQVGQEITRRNLDIQPTLTERPGLPLRVIVNRDLVLRPYQPLFIQWRNQ